MLLKMALFHSFFMTNIPVCVCVCVFTASSLSIYVLMVAYDLVVVSSATLNTGLSVSRVFIFSEFTQGRFLVHIFILNLT